MDINSKKWHLNLHEPLLPATIARLEDPARKRVFEPKIWLKVLGSLESKKVADVACGTGAFTSYLLDAVGADGEVYAIDIDPRMIEHVSKRFCEYKNFSPILSTASYIPLASNFLDAAVLISAFHDLDGILTLKEIWRILKPRSKLVVLDWKKIKQDFGPAYEIRKSEEEAEEILKSAGFLCKFFEVSDSAWGAVCTKSKKPAIIKRA
jgi:ubiquinone/menaquinone biosynthesis C-methylase UbiE